MLPLGKVIAQGLSRETRWFSFEECPTILETVVGNCFDSIVCLTN